jgi:hypothetical protein
MNKKLAIQVLNDMWCVMSDNNLECNSPFIAWPNSPDGFDEIGLDGAFTADQLEAIAWWMKHNHSEEKY